MEYCLYYHPDIKKEDLPKIPNNIRDRIKRAIEKRLLKEPLKYGEPLKRSLQGSDLATTNSYKIIIYEKDRP